jgi:uncharacterized membrane protein
MNKITSWSLGIGFIILGLDFFLVGFSILSTKITSILLALAIMFIAFGLISKIKKDEKE